MNEAQIELELIAHIGLAFRNWYLAEEALKRARAMNGGAS